MPLWVNAQQRPGPPGPPRQDQQKEEMEKPEEDEMPSDSTKTDMEESTVEKDTVPPITFCMEVWVDYGKLLTLPLSFETKYEAGINFLYKEKYALVLEGGMGDNDPNTYENMDDYNVKGWYARAGLDYVFPINPSNNMYFGVRYGIAQYSDEGSYKIESEFWQSYDNDFDRSDLTASWGEILMGSETMLSDQFMLGFKFRLRVMIDYDEQSPVDVYSIPGYGRTFDRSIPAFNLYLKYRLAF